MLAFHGHYQPKARLTIRLCHLWPKIEAS